MTSPTLTSVLLAALVGLATLDGCKTEGETEDFIGGTMTSSKPNGSAGGFSATLGADLAKTSGSAGSAMAGSAMAGSAMAGSAMAGSAKASGSAMSGSAAPEAKIPAGSASTPPAGSGAVAVVTPPVVVRPRVLVAPPADVAAIKLKLEPNWERDIGEAATISRNVDAVTRTVLFVFYYGYDDATAPKEREQYIKWLAEKKLLVPSNPTKPLLNRQRGAAWYLEGLDSAGAPAFRYLVNYGDKKLLCHGSLYKDTGLADTRDEVIIQAKKICESISL